MHSLIFLVAATTLGVDVGYQPLPEGGLEYIIQIEPQLLGTLKQGQDLESEIPAELNVRKFRITVGSGKLPQQLEQRRPGTPPAKSPAAASNDATGVDAAAAAPLRPRRPLSPRLNPLARPPRPRRSKRLPPIVRQTCVIQPATARRWSRWPRKRSRNSTWSTRGTRPKCWTNAGRRRNCGWTKRLTRCRRRVRRLPLGRPATGETRAKRTSRRHCHT